MQPKKPLVKRLKLDILIENSSFKADFLAEHGLSILIESETEDNKKFKLLFDTGSSGRPLVHNLNKLEKKISNLDGIIISHGHYDHTGGLMETFKLLDRKIPIYLHPHALNPKYSKEEKKIRAIGLPFKISEIEKYADLKLSNAPQIIHPSIITTGQIERLTPYEKVPLRFQQKINGDMVHDDILDDQALIIKLKTGIVLIAGCGHSGIVNTVKKSIVLTGTERINLITGGFHLINANLDVIEATINDLKKFQIDLISPNHCTGLYPTARLIYEYLDNFREMHVGDSFTLE